MTTTERINENDMDVVEEQIPIKQTKHIIHTPPPVTTK